VLSLAWLLLYSNNQTTESINTKHNKYNRHATTNQIILSLVTEVKKNVSLRMVKVWPKHVGEF
jgi:hypothetical protein